MTTDRLFRPVWRGLMVMAAVPLLSVLGAAAQGTAPLADSAAVAPAGPLTLADVVALSLRNNPDTRAAYAQAQAAAALYGVSRGSLFPTVSASAPVTRSKSVSGGGSFGGERTQFNPGLSMSYLLFDFGGRSGTIAQARETAVAASAQSDVTVQGTVLEAEAAFFGYNAARDVAAAGRENVRTATEARDAAIQLWRVGLATVADTLQASTALAQAELSLLTAQGQVQTARGELASVMGIPADSPFEVVAPPGPLTIRTVAAGVDSLMARAVRERPELAAAQAEAAGAAAQIRVARAAALPSLTLGGNAGRNFSSISTQNGNTYGLSVGLSVPIFSGFARRDAMRAARATLDAARARVEATRVRVANQVYTSYTSLQVAAARVRASAQLLASAVQSEAVARGRYREGVGSIIDLLTAQNALASARAQDAQSRWVWQTALSQLAHDVGTLDRSGAPGLPLTISNATPAPEVTP
ncbi:MAG TPA: TolC family protein [Longimicrobiaceae bacterium]|nr:TolC family protein [Longimicrobiaceae bacterium]